MGDLQGESLGGTLYFVPRNEFQRVLKSDLNTIQKTRIFSYLCRINVLYMIAKAGSGHIGSSFSSLEIMSWLYLNQLKVSQKADDVLAEDVFFSSKGHDAPALYSVLTALGLIPFEKIHYLRRLEGLPGHPDLQTPFIATNTGSLGMGVSKAKGMLFAKNLLKKPGHVFVLTGDGELQEGQFWESLVSAANHKVQNLVVIIDHNKLQSDTLVSKVSDLGDLQGKLRSFGWHVARCDGNNLEAFSSTLNDCLKVLEKPKVIIADTIKGKGVSFMEHTSIDSDVELYKFHSGAPGEKAYQDAATELIAQTQKWASETSLEKIQIETVNRPQPVTAQNPQKLIQAYSNHLIKIAEKRQDLVALDADLILDTGLIPFQKQFPHRFIECGIAEQDMVSQAGGLALAGALPVVHSFACFLSSRPNEQIYNNSTENKKIIYVGSLAGVVPGGPGHSHQSVRDISALGGMPGLTLIEPSCEKEVALQLDWAVNQNNGSTYLRLVSIPCEIPYVLPDDYQIKIGQGVTLLEGSEVAIITYGPVLLTEAYHAIQNIKKATGRSLKLINLPWLNTVDSKWLANSLKNITMVITLDNHYLIGGQGDRVASALLEAQSTVKLVRRGIDQVPVSGTNAEVLKFHGLDRESIAHVVKACLAEQK